ncbi:hypothetical protein ALC60_11781, partial [Trachymyrmex zeteki]
FSFHGAPAHFLVNVRYHLTSRFQERWIGRGGPVVWPPRSPNLNPLDYYLWGHLKSMVYVTSVDTIDELTQRIENCCQQIRNKSKIFERVRSLMRRRAKLCVEMEGALNIYCKLKLFSIFHRRKCFITQK